MEETSKKPIFIGIAAVAIVLATVIFYLLNPLKRTEDKNITETAEEISETVPEITTNPIENKVPELNPIERANPFKYENPFR